MRHANDNRTPSEHRDIVSGGLKRNPRQHASRWPTAERHATEEGGKYLTAALLDWRHRNRMPVVCVANDNFPEDSDAEVGEAPEYRFDNRMDHDTADRTYNLHVEGKEWNPGEEVFNRPHRNDRGNALPPAGSYRVNGLDLPNLPDAESEMANAIDTKNLRHRYGPIRCRVLDLASGDATRAEIAAALKQPDTPRIDTFVDWAALHHLRDGMMEAA